MTTPVLTIHDPSATDIIGTVVAALCCDIAGRAAVSIRTDDDGALAVSIDSTVTDVGVFYAPIREADTTGPLFPAPPAAPGSFPKPPARSGVDECTDGQEGPESLLAENAPEPGEVGDPAFAPNAESEYGWTPVGYITADGGRGQPFDLDDSASRANHPTSLDAPAAEPEPVIREVPAPTVAKRIETLLANYGPLTLSEITTKLGYKSTGATYNTLRKMLDNGQVEKHGTRYHLAGTVLTEPEPEPDIDQAVTPMLDESQLSEALITIVDDYPGGIDAFHALLDLPAPLDGIATLVDVTRVIAELAEAGIVTAATDTTGQPIYKPLA